MVGFIILELYQGLLSLSSRFLYNQVDLSSHSQVERSIHQVLFRKRFPTEASLRSAVHHNVSPTELIVSISSVDEQFQEERNALVRRS